MFLAECVSTCMCVADILCKCVVLFWLQSVLEIRVDGLPVSIQQVTTYTYATQDVPDIVCVYRPTIHYSHPPMVSL